MQDQSILENTILGPDFESNSSFPIKALMSSGAKTYRLSCNQEDFSRPRRRVRFAYPLTIDLVADAEAKKEAANLDQTYYSDVDEEEFRAWLFGLDPNEFPKPCLSNPKYHDNVHSSRPRAVKVIREDVSEEKLKEYQSRRKAVARGFERLQQRILSNFASPKAA